MESGLTESEVNRIAGHLLGTPASPEDALLALDIELPADVQIDSLEADLADRNLERSLQVASGSLKPASWWTERAKRLVAKALVIGK